MMDTQLADLERRLASLEGAVRNLARRWVGEKLYLSTLHGRDLSLSGDLSVSGALTLLSTLNGGSAYNILDLVSNGNVLLASRGNIILRFDSDATASDKTLSIVHDASSVLLTISEAGLFTLVDAGNLAVGTGTGTKIGTATGQKLGFWNAAPVIQRSHITDATDAATVITRCNALILALEQVGILAAA